MKIPYIVLHILLCAAIAFAQLQQSEHFRISKSVLDAGGGASSSANFQLVSAFGQPTPIGLSSSEHFSLTAGYLTPEFSVSPLSPIQDLVIHRGAGPTDDVLLNWSEISGATSYIIYRDATPTFTPDPANQIGTSALNSYIDEGAVNLSGVKYYYIVTASDGGSPMPRVPRNGTQR